MGRLIQRLEDWYNPIRSSVFAFAKEMGVTPTWQQAQFLDLVQKETHPPPGFVRKGRIAVKSGQGPGKTVAAVLAGGWRSIFAKGAMTIVTAPSMRQCRDVWLTEFRRRRDEASAPMKQLVTVTRSRVIIAGDQDWGCLLVTAKDSAAMQGYHEGNLTIIVEEASGVDREFIEQIKGTLSNPNALLIMIGNPNTNDCAFHECFSTQRDLWHTLTFNAEDTARDYPHILSPERNRLLALEYGRESDVYRVRVLGEFPHSDPSCVMSPEDLDACTRTKKYEMAVARRQHGKKHEVAKQFGIDLARYGSDESVVCRRQGNAIVSMKCYSKIDPAIVVESAFREQQDAQWSSKECEYIFDVTGMGQGVAHMFHRAKKNVMEFNNGGTAADSKSFANRITEAWFNMRTLVKAHKCYLPNDARLLQQLGTRQYYLDKDGKFILETKQDYKDRGFESPDRADACVMAFYDRAESETSVLRPDQTSKQVGARVGV